MRSPALALVLALLAPALAAAAAPTPEQLRADFEFFWNSYKEAYVFFDLKAADHGVDWDQLRQEYQPTIDALATPRDLMRLISEFQAKLQDGHCGNEGMTAVGPISLLRGIGFTVGEGNTVFVAGVKAGSVFAEAGLARGDEVLTMAGQPVATLARTARSLFGASSEGQFWNLFGRLLHVWHPYRGEAPATCRMSVRKPDGTVVDVDAPWDVFDPAGTKATPSLDKILEIDAAGALPMKAHIYEDLNIGYVSVETFMKTEDPTAQFDKVFGAMKDTAGLIIDVRGNGGGVGPWGVLLASYLAGDGPNGSYMERRWSETFFRMVFSSNNVPPAQYEPIFTDPEMMHAVLGQFGVKMTLDEVKAHFVDGHYQPFELRMPLRAGDAGIPPYDKPVVALVDGGCYSTTDIFLTLLRDFDRVTLVGSPNGAGSGSPIPMVLPTLGIKVMVPHARAYPPSGRMIEGRPLPVDYPVEPTQDDLISGTDRTLATGLAVLCRNLGLIDDDTRLGGSDVPLAQLTVRPLLDTTGSMIPEELRALIPDSVREGLAAAKVKVALQKALKKR